MVYKPTNITGGPHPEASKLRDTAPWCLQDVVTIEVNMPADFADAVSRGPRGLPMP